MPIKRKSTRLVQSNYVGQRPYFITICCDQRRSYLADPVVAQLILQTLLKSAASRNFLIHAYCLMPDHVHVLTQGVHPTSDLLEFIRVFKQC